MQHQNKINDVCHFRPQEAERGTEKVAGRHEVHPGPEHGQQPAGQREHRQTGGRNQRFQQIHQGTYLGQVQKRLAEHSPDQQADPLADQRRAEGRGRKGAERCGLHLAGRQHAVQVGQLRDLRPRHGDTIQDSQDHKGLFRL